VRFLERERDQKKQREYDYLGVIEILGIVAVHRVEAFWDNRKQAEMILKQEDKRLKEIQEQQVTTGWKVLSTVWGPKIFGGLGLVLVDLCTRSLLKILC